MELREDTNDEWISREVLSSYNRLDVKDKVVLDVGACFGAATCMFLERGAAKVISVEPDPGNFKQLKKNAGRDRRVTLINAAVGTDTKDKVLYLNLGRNRGSHSMYVTRRKDSVTVPGVKFDALLKEYRPEVLKIDCEGAEYDFLTKPVPSYVRQVVVELHLLGKPEGQDRARAIAALFGGWETVKAPRIDKPARGNTALGLWRR